jgi:hypothetical protein
VREALDGVRGEARRKRDFAQREESQSSEEKHYHEHEHTHMGDTFNMGDAIGSAVGGRGNRVENSGQFYIQRADLPVLLQAVKALTEASTKLTPADAATVQPHVAVITAGAKTIEAESKKAEPNKGLLELTKDGMVTAAKTCAAMAPSLFETAKAVAEWFSNAG